MIYLNKDKNCKENDPKEFVLVSLQQQAEDLQNRAGDRSGAMLKSMNEDHKGCQGY